MPGFSQDSLTKLSTCDKRLYNIASIAILIMDFTVITGHRTQSEQDKAFIEGRSKLKWPDGKHNNLPSTAIDICPYRNGLQWNDKEAFILLAGIMLAVAFSQGIKLRWGGDWNSDFNTHDNSFDDLGHFEIVE